MRIENSHILGASGRQAAYTARNRAALIEAAQVVLAEIGPDATIEQFVAQAKSRLTLSITTLKVKSSFLVKHFSRSISNGWLGLTTEKRKAKASRQL